MWQILDKKEYNQQIDKPNRVCRWNKCCFSVFFVDHHVINITESTHGQPNEPSNWIETVIRYLFIMLSMITGETIMTQTYSFHLFQIAFIFSLFFWFTVQYRIQFGKWNKNRTEALQRWVCCMKTQQNVCRGFNTAIAFSFVSAQLNGTLPHKYTNINDLQWTCS